MALSLDPLSLSFPWFPTTRQTPLPHSLSHPIRCLWESLRAHPILQGFLKVSHGGVKLSHITPTLWRRASAVSPAREERGLQERGRGEYDLQHLISIMMHPGCSERSHAGEILGCPSTEPQDSEAGKGVAQKGPILLLQQPLNFVLPLCTCTSPAQWGLLVMEISGINWVQIP